MKHLYFLFFFMYAGVMPAPGADVPKLVRVYNWHGYMPASVLKRFTAETGITVDYDVYDSNEVLEAKLLTGASGYDVVFPSSWPYLARQISAGLYRPLDASLIPNYTKIDPTILDFLKNADNDNRYAVPFLWGVSGFAYNKDSVKKLAPLAPTDSWAMFFDPAVAEKFNKCGITLLEEAEDVFLAARLYLGLSPDSDSDEDMKKVQTLLTAIRPFIRRFDASRSNDDIASGEMCLTQHWLGSIAASSDKLKNHHRRAEIELVIPKEGAPIWIDVMAIPNDAPHVASAHAFINFVLRPDNMAEISNETFFANPVPESLPGVRADIKNNDALYPSPKTMKRLFLGKTTSMKYYKRISRIMTRIRSGR